MSNRPSQQTRLFCPVCGGWTQRRGESIILSLVEGVQPGDEWFDDVQNAKQDMSGFGDFVERHFGCLSTSTYSCLEFIDEDDARYQRLDPQKKE